MWFSNNMQPDSEAPRVEPTEYPHPGEVRPAETLAEPKQETLFNELAKLDKRQLEIWDQLRDDAHSLGNDFWNWKNTMSGVNEWVDPSKEQYGKPSPIEYYFEKVDEGGEKKGFFVKSRDETAIFVRELMTNQADPSTMKVATSLKITPWSGVGYMSRNEETGEFETSSITIHDMMRKGEIQAPNDRDPLVEGRRILSELRGSKPTGVVEDQDMELVVKPLPGIEGPGQTIIRFDPLPSGTPQNS